MRGSLLFLPILLVLLTNSLGVFAQENKPGTLRGTVLNQQGEPVVGANVYVKETSDGVATDVEGRFELRLKPGTYTLRVSYVAYQNKTIQGITIEAGEVNYLGNVQMSSDSNNLEGVVISADRVKNSEKAMLSMKQQSAELIDGISAEKFAKTGDGDAASAMKRVTGVSVQGGKYVFVRGLGGRYTQTTLGEVAVPSLDPNRNSIQMDLFPTNVLSSIVVSKTFTPEQPANFAGGLVNIETKAFPAEQSYSISAGIGYTPSMHLKDNFLTYQGGSTDFLGFDDGTREVPTKGVNRIPFRSTALFDESARQQYTDILGNFNENLGAERQQNFMDYDFSFSGGDQFDLGPYNAAYNFALTYKNKRDFYQSAEFNTYGKPDDPSIYELELRESRKGEYSKKNTLLGGLGGLSLKSKHSKYKFNILRLQKGIKKAGFYDVKNQNEGSVYQAEQHNLTFSQRSLTNVLLSGDHYLSGGDWELDWEVSPTFSKMEDPDVRYTRLRRQDIGSEQRPSYSVGSEAGIPRRIWRDMEETNYFGKADLTYNTELFGREADIKSGLAYTYKERSYSIKDFNINPNKTDIQGPDPDQILADSNLWTDGSEGGTYYNPAFVNADGNRNNRNKYSATVSKPAAYLSAEAKPLPDLTMLAGVRMEQYQQEYSDYVTDNEQVLDDLDLFPSLNFTYAVNDNQNLRLSYSRTIARPSFKELSRVTIFDPISGRVFIGGQERYEVNNEVTWDGNLSATRINNFDLRWEWFQQRNQMVSVSVFSKTFDNPIEIVQLIEGKSNLQPRNVGNGQLAGVEVEVRQSLSRIHQTLKNLAFNANFTYTESQIDIASNELQTRQQSLREGKELDETRPMTRQAPYVVNGGFAYQNPEIGLSVGTYYNVKGKTLYFVGVGDLPDVYQEPFHNLKLNATYSFGEEDRYSLSFEAENLLNDDREKFFEAYRAQDRPFSRLSPGRSSSLSFGVNF